MFTESVSFSAAFIAGLLSFLSPCILPLIPAYFSFITGLSMDELLGDSTAAVRKKVLISTVVFVCGFSAIFILLGASATLLGQQLDLYRDHIRIIGGHVIVLFGLHLMGWIQIPALNMDRRFHMTQKPLRLMGVFLVGMAFGAGWSPCVGPMLGSILVIASTQESIWNGIALLAVYSAGLAIPFILLSLFINLMLEFFHRAKRIVVHVHRLAGALLIVVGFFLLTDGFSFFYRLIS
ncbi:MAG: cytochrome c biogenesis protein CcdA [Desulfobacteraceae bacterium]|jgi:cytochrome c-type biogenesis protein|nr:MAG: cytochrome c biogenesis protein CcdA [Desulfobacteraceae bacterium]